MYKRQIIVTTDEHYCYVFIAAHAHTQGGIQWLKLYSDPDYAETLCFDDVSTTHPVHFTNIVILLIIFNIIILPTMLEIAIRVRPNCHKLSDCMQHKPRINYR